MNGDNNVTISGGATIYTTTATFIPFSEFAGYVCMVTGNWNQPLSAGQTYTFQFSNGSSSNYTIRGPGIGAVDSPYFAITPTPM